MNLRRRFAALFATLAVCLCAGFAIALLIAARRVGAPEAASAFLNAGLIGGFMAILLCAGAWLVFDETVARPLQRLAATFRARAHVGVSGCGVKEGGPQGAAAFPSSLGDLGPAARALCESLRAARGEVDERLATETAALEAEKAQLGAVLSEIPVAVLAVGPNHRIVLYDRQCVHALGQVAPLGLDHSVFDYLEETPLRGALEELARAPGRGFADVELPLARGAGTIAARLRPVGEGFGYLLAMEVEGAAAERPLVFDFGVIDREQPEDIARTLLARTRFVVFDTETTGLSPERDEIVQIGAVRLVNGRIVAGERFATLVDPGRPIPPASSRIHGVTDDMVKGAPSLGEAGRAFHDFARGAVLVAHNAPFDFGFLRRAEGRVGRRFDFPVLDTVLLSAALFGDDAGHSLDEIAERFDVAIDGAARHTALGDAEATAAVLARMLPMLAAQGIMTFGQAVEAMRRRQRLSPDLNEI